MHADKLPLTQTHTDSQTHRHTHTPTHTHTHADTHARACYRVLGCGFVIIDMWSVGWIFVGVVGLGLADY